MRNDRAFLWKAAGGLAVIALLLFVIGGQTIRVSSEQERNFELVTRGFEVKNAIDEVGVHLRAASTAQRAYVLTNEPIYAEQFEEAERTTLASLAKLQPYIRQGSIQQVTFDWFSILVKEQLENYGINVQLQRNGESDNAVKLIDSVRSHSQLEAIADVIRQLEKEEENILSAQVSKTRDNTHETESLVLGGLGVSFLVIVFAGMTIFRDLNRRLAVERALGESLNFERALVDSAAYGIIATNADRVITEFNRAAEKMLGYKVEELVGKSTPERFHDPKEVADRATTLSLELGRTVEPGLDTFFAIPDLGMIEDREWTMIRKNGERFPARLSVTAIRGTEGQISGYLAIASDITERKKIERLKTEFISTVSHELRTPLTSIRGSLGLVLGGVSGDLPPQAKELLNVANKNSERLSRLINDILDGEKIESGKMEFNMKRQALAPLLQQAVDSTKDFARQFNVSFQLVNKAQDIEVDIDADRLIQVLVNLLSNAAKFSPANSTVAMGAERHNGMVRITVRDSGRGIPVEFQGRVFEKFAQADSSDSRQKSGTGLGLSISKAIVERMGGRISFLTDHGRGTTFRVDLPELPGQERVISYRPQSSKGDRILICEDDADIARLLQMMLKQGGYEADIASSAAEARSRLKSGAYCALSLDINLPDQNGLDFLRALRDEPTTCDLPVVIVSAESDNRKRELSGTAINVVDWLEKPIDGIRLINAVRRASIANNGLTARVLHIEDNADVNRLVGDILAPVATVDCAGTIADAMNKMRQNVYDLVLLDMSLPDGRGSDILPIFRARMPVVIFSAQEVPDDIKRQVATALIKSRTSNDMLLTTITDIMNRSLPLVSVA